MTGLLGRTGTADVSAAAVLRLPFSGDDLRLAKPLPEVRRVSSMSPNGSPKLSSMSPVHTSSRGEGWGEELLPQILKTKSARWLPLTQIAPDDAEPVIGRAFARPVGVAEAIRPNRKWGGEPNSAAPIQLKP